MHDGVKKNGYTFDNIRDAIITNIQTTFEPSRLAVNFLRERVKKDLSTPERIISNKIDTVLNVIQQVSLDKILYAELAHWFTKSDQFEDN